MGNDQRAQGYKLLSLYINILVNYIERLGGLKRPYRFHLARGDQSRGEWLHRLDQVEYYWVRATDRDIEIFVKQDFKKEFNVQQ